MEKLTRILKGIKKGFCAIADWTFKAGKRFMEDDSIMKYVYDVVLGGGGIFGFIFWLLTRSAPAGTMITKTAFIHAHAGWVALAFGLLVAGALVCFDIMAGKKAKEDL